MTDNETIPPSFLQYASNVLADTQNGLSGSIIVSETNAYAVEYGVNIPHSIYPFEAPNKRTALYENLAAFSAQQQYRIIKALCEHRIFGSKVNPDLRQLKIRLLTRFSRFSSSSNPSEINETLIEEAKHWLSDHPESLELFNAAISKFEHRVFLRNVLDDLRLSMEKLLHNVFENRKSLENQIQNVGSYISDRGGSKELANMFVKLVDYYTKYQNTYVKHDDAVIEQEIEFVFEITAAFMKHIIKLSSASSDSGNW